jgi:hypothetical protein
MIMSVRTHRLFLLEERKWPVASEKRTGNCECTRVSSPAQQKTSEKFSVASLAEGAQSFLGFWISVDTLRKIPATCRMMSEGRRKAIPSGRKGIIEIDAKFLTRFFNLQRLKPAVNVTQASVRKQAKASVSQKQSQ